MKKIFLLFIFLLPLSAFSAGIQVKPERLEFQATKNSPAKQELIVVNPTADSQLFEIYPDDYREIFVIQPRSFILESGAQKKVILTVLPDKLEEGILAANLSITAVSLIDAKTKEVNVGAGLKIPFTIQLSSSVEKSFWQFYGLIALACLIVIGLVIWLIRRRRKGIHLFGKKIIG